MATRLRMEIWCGWTEAGVAEVPRFGLAIVTNKSNRRSERRPEKLIIITLRQKIGVSRLSLQKCFGIISVPREYLFTFHFTDGAENKIVLLCVSIEVIMYCVTKSTLIFAPGRCSLLVKTGRKGCPPRF